MWKKIDVKSLRLRSPETSSAETNAVILTLIAFSVSSCGNFGTTLLSLGIIKPRTGVDVGVKWCSQGSARRGSGAGSSCPGCSEDRVREEGITAPLVEGQIWLLRLPVASPSSPWLALLCLPRAEVLGRHPAFSPRSGDAHFCLPASGRRSHPSLHVDLAPRWSLSLSYF